MWRRAVLWVLNVRVSYRQETLEALAEGRAVVICMEHRSLADGPIVALASPFPLHFAVTPKHAVDNLFTAQGIRFLMWLGLGDRTAINGDHPFSLRALHRVLKGGSPVMIFPEGRIASADESIAARGGYQWLADSTSSPVVTISMDGNEQSRIFAPAGRLLRPRITLTF
jgi:acyl-[acyl-carrier-protein]-phospholipid O-acyltransferase/long-chain-fatty-acid--[acyl-carrier-protein] ligase